MERFGDSGESRHELIERAGARPEVALRVAASEVAHEVGLFRAFDAYCDDAYAELVRQVDDAANHRTVDAAFVGVTNKAVVDLHFVDREVA